MINQYIKLKNRPFAPIYVPGEQYSFYLNFDNPVTDNDFGNFVLRIYSGDQMVANNVGVLQQDIVQGDAYNIFSIFQFPVVPLGYYQFVIFDTGVNIEKARSSFILCETDPTALQAAPTVLFRNETNRNNTNYEGLPDFFHVFRLPLNPVDFQYDLTKTQYRNASDQRLRNIKSFKYKYRTIESYYFDENGHDAAAEMYEHDGIYIDGIKYVTKDGYQQTTDQLSGLTKGKVDCYVDNPNVIYTFPINQRSIFPTPQQMAQKTTILINDGSQKIINWQNDTIAGTTITYAQRHGNSAMITENDYQDGKWTENAVPSFEMTKDAFNNIIQVVLNPQVDKSEFIII